jgi:hypothetical protein
VLLELSSEDASTYLGVVGGERVARFDREILEGVEEGALEAPSSVAARECGQRGGEVRGIVQEVCDRGRARTQAGRGTLRADCGREREGLRGGQASVQICPS